MARNNLYNQLNSLISEYFELSSRSFLDDIIAYHLNIDPIKLTKSGLIEIQSWLEITIAMMVKDKKSLTILTSKLKELTETE